MPKDDLVYIGHMLDSARQALRLIQGRSREAYDRDEALRLALAHVIQIIGEAARRVSARAREQHPEIPWRQIVGMRHKVVHDYLDVDFGVVWEVATGDLPRLEAALAKAVAAMEEEGGPRSD